jgi:hypothetical protein
MEQENPMPSFWGRRLTRGDDAAAGKRGPSIWGIGNLMLTFRFLCAICWLNLSAFGPASACADFIQASQPAHSGSDEYKIKLPGLPAGLGLDVIVAIVGTDTPQQKAEKIAAAINAAGGIAAVVGPPSGTSGECARDGFSEG